MPPIHAARGKAKTMTQHGHLKAIPCATDPCPAFCCHAAQSQSKLHPNHQNQIAADGTPQNNVHMACYGCNRGWGGGVGGAGGAGAVDKGPAEGGCFMVCRGCCIAGWGAGLRGIATWGMMPAPRGLRPSGQVAAKGLGAAMLPCVWATEPPACKPRAGAGIRAGT